MNWTQNKWLKFGLSVVMAVIVLFALVFEIQIPVFDAGGAGNETFVGDMESFAVRERIAIDTGEDSFLHTGADLYVYSDAYSSQTLHIDGATGDIDSEGDLDFAGDVEIGGVQVFDLNEFGTATITTDTTEYLFEIYDSTPVMTGGTNSLAGLNIDLGIGNSTAGTNSIYGILVDGITADAQNTETGVSIGSGWDVALDVDGAVTIDGGLTNIGGATGGVADGDNDLLVTAVLEVDGELELDGTLDADSTSDFADTATFSKGSGNAIVVSAGGALNIGGKYPLLYATTGKQVVCGSSTISSTLAVSHGLTTPSYAVCSLGEDPGTSAGDLVSCSASISEAVVTVKGWQDDWSAGANDTTVFWCVVGTP